MVFSNFRKIPGPPEDVQQLPPDVPHLPVPPGVWPVVTVRPHLLLALHPPLPGALRRNMAQVNIIIKIFSPSWRIFN